MKIKEQIGQMLIRGIAKATGTSSWWRLWDRGEDISVGSASPAQPYKQVSLIFTCIEKIINAVSGIPLVLSTIDEKIIEDGPVYDLLFNNPSMTWQQFITQTVGHYALMRDVFWLFPEMAGSMPTQILVISGTQMHAQKRGDELLSWQFRGSGGQVRDFLPEQVHQIKNFNPYDRWHGISPLSPAGADINYTYAAALYNASALNNGAEPGTILIPEGRPTPEEIEMLRANFNARHQGPGQAKRTAILSGIRDIKSLTMTLADMEVAEITKLTDNKICSALGVPPGVAGLITEAQYSHGPAMRDFIFNMIIPLAVLLADEITKGILSRVSVSKFFGGGPPNAIAAKDTKFFGGSQLAPFNRYYKAARHKAVSVQSKLFSWFDSSQHPVVQEAMAEQADKVLKFTQSGVPLNQLILAHDLPYKSVPWGDDWWVAMGQVPARFALEAGIEGITGPALPEGQPAGEGEGKNVSAESAESASEKIIESAKSVAEKADDQQRLRLWRSWVISWAGIEREYREALRIYFVRQQRILIDKLRQTMDSAKSSVVKISPDEIIARVVLDLKLENQKIKVIHQTFFGKASELGIRQVLSEVAGLRDDKLDGRTEILRRSAWLKGKLLISTQKISGINKTTQNLVARQLKDGLDASEGIGDLTARIGKTLGSNRSRALSIARTSTAGAIGSGRHAGMKDSGVELKSWITAGDSFVRPAHVEAGRTYAQGIPLEQPFIVDNESLMFPGDPSGSAANIINCRCLDIARRAAGKDFNDAFYSNLQFYSYTEMKSAKSMSEIKDNKNED